MVTCKSSLRISLLVAAGLFSGYCAMAVDSTAPHVTAPKAIAPKATAPTVGQRLDQAVDNLDRIAGETHSSIVRAEDKAAASLDRAASSANRSIADTENAARAAVDNVNRTSSQSVRDAERSVRDAARNEAGSVRNAIDRADRSVSNAARNADAYGRDIAREAREDFDDMYYERGGAGIDRLEARERVIDSNVGRNEATAADFRNLDLEQVFGGSPSVEELQQFKSARAISAINDGIPSRTYRANLTDRERERIQGYENRLRDETRDYVEKRDELERDLRAAQPGSSQANRLQQDIWDLERKISNEQVRFHERVQDYVIE